MDELSALPVAPSAIRVNLAEVAVLERARSWAPAQQSRVLAALEVAEPRDFDPDSRARPAPHATTPQEIALVLRVSTAAARGRVDLHPRRDRHQPAPRPPSRRPPSRRPPPRRPLIERHRDATSAAHRAARRTRPTTATAAFPRGPLPRWATRRPTGHAPQPSAGTVPAAEHTDFPTPEASGVGNPTTGHGWLTQMQTYTTTTHDRGRANHIDSPPRAERPSAHHEGWDDPPPF